MSSTKWKTILAIGVVLVLSGAQVHVQADLDGRAAKGSSPTKAAGVPLFGKVITAGGKAVLINGNRVSSGTTVFSGSILRTLDSVSATILLGPAGKLDVAPKTSLRIFFDVKKIEVALEQGGAILTTNAGISGMIKTPAGTTERIGPERGSVIDVYTGESPAVPPTVGQAAAAKAGAGVVDPMYGRVPGPGVNPLSFAIGSGSLATAATACRRPVDTRPVSASKHKP